MINDELAEVGVEGRNVGAAIDRPQLGRPADRTAFTEAPNCRFSSRDAENEIQRRDRIVDHWKASVVSDPLLHAGLGARIATGRWVSSPASNAAPRLDSHP